MQAIIEDRGRQFVVQDGDTITVDFMDGVEPGSEVVFDRVLAVGDNFGTPVVEGAKITAKVVEHSRGDKVVTFKYTRRQRTRRRVGFRAHQTALQIASIEA